MLLPLRSLWVDPQPAWAGLLLRTGSFWLTYFPSPVWGLLAIVSATFSSMTHPGVSTPGTPYVCARPSPNWEVALPFVFSAGGQVEKIPQPEWLLPEWKMISDLSWVFNVAENNLFFSVRQHFLGTPCQQLWALASSLSPTSPHSL